MAQAYCLAPKGDENREVYRLLQQAFEQNCMAGIATFVMRRHR
ncbi:hypothetical protein ACFVYT_37300 [Streptomyces sp. NPDC058290]